MILHRWADPEFDNAEDMSRGVEAGTGTEEEEVAVDMEDNREMVNNCSSREEEVGIHLEELRNKLNQHGRAKTWKS